MALVAASRQLAYSWGHERGGAGVAERQNGKSKYPAAVASLSLSLKTCVFDQTSVYHFNSSYCPSLPRTCTHFAVLQVLWFCIPRQCETYSVMNCVIVRLTEANTEITLTVADCDQQTLQSSSISCERVKAEWLVSPSANRQRSGSPVLLPNLEQNR
jgi:hypothetical protein